MQTRAVRLSILALLLASGITAAIFAWDSERRLAAIEQDRQTLDAALERASSAVAGIAAAQQAYIDYGERDEATFTRVSSLLEQIGAETAPLRGLATSAGSTAAVADFSAALAALREAEGRARESLAADETLTAADTLLGASRDQTATLAAKLRVVRDTEAARFVSDRGTLTQQAWAAVGGTALLWLLGLLALTPIPKARQPLADATPAPVSIEPDALIEPTVETSPLPIVPIDLTAAAELCTGISQLNDAAALPALLQKGAAILEARGIILWMGAGDELFAAASCGYDEAVISRLRPIGRTADNATAAAWRSGEIRTVAGDATSHGAIVAPMFGAGGPVGVLAAEVRNGREEDAATRAVAAIIASQLAMVLSAWPSASVAGSPTQSDRQAAAS